MKVFFHHIYEYKKGLRNLILHTTPKNQQKKIEEKLEKEGIPYIIYPVGNKNINVFFGSESCVKIIENINKPRLSEYTCEEDFILGIMLGYDIIQQCHRFFKRKNKENVGNLIG